MRPGPKSAPQPTALPLLRFSAIMSSAVAMY